MEEEAIAVLGSDDPHQKKRGAEQSQAGSSASKKAAVEVRCMPQNTIPADSLCCSRGWCGEKLCTHSVPSVRTHAGTFAPEAERRQVSPRRHLEP